MENLQIETFMSNLVASLDDVNESAAKPEANFDAFASWDSLAALSVIVMINTEYGVEVSGTELKSCTTLSQLFNIVRSKAN